MKSQAIFSALALWGMAISAWCRAPFCFWFCMVCLFWALIGMVGLEVKRLNKRDRDLGEVLNDRRGR